MVNVIKKFVSGSVNATIFKNVSSDLKISFITLIERTYKDKDDKWQHSNKFFESDLNDVEVVSEEAKKFLRLKTFSDEDFTKQK